MMIRSHRLALAPVVLLGLTTCGDPSTTAPLADQPKVIELASGQPSGGSGQAPMAAGADPAESKIGVMAPTEFVYDGDLPVIDGPAASWFFSPGEQADLGRVAELAKSLGVEGAVRATAPEQGGGWAVGPEDFTGPVLTVAADGMLSWWFSPGPIAPVGYACAQPGVAVDPVAGGDAPVVVGEAVDAPPPGVSAPGVVDTIGRVPDCPEPQPPVGVPTSDEALAKAKELFASWGRDVGSLEFDPVYADQWSASVTAYLTLDGMKAPVASSVGFGENGSVTWASGSLAAPQRGADYPTIGTKAGLERLKTQQNQYIGLGGPAVMDTASGGVAPPALGAPEPAPGTNLVCEPGPAVDCAPVDAEPVIITLNSVEPDLIMVWAADSTIWLLPAYSFGSADGGVWTVNAVDDAYLKQVEPSPGGTSVAVPPPATDFPVVVDPEQPSAECATFDPNTPTTDAPLTTEWAQHWVGQCLSYAQQEVAAYGWQVRVVRENGVDLVVTADFSDTRLNVAVEDGIITEIVAIG